jgi:hypothetical protein
MTNEPAPASGVGVITLTVQWDADGGKLQTAVGGDWGPQGQARLFGALKAAADKAQEAMIEAAVQERMAKAASEAAVRG